MRWSGCIHTLNSVPNSNSNSNSNSNHNHNHNHNKNNTSHFTQECALFFVRCLVETASAVDHGGRQRQRRLKAARATAQAVPSAQTCERRLALSEKKHHTSRGQRMDRAREVGSRSTTRPSSGSASPPGFPARLSLPEASHQLLSFLLRIFGVSLAIQI